MGSDVINLCSSSLPAGHLCNNDPDTSFDPSPYVVAYQAATPTAKYIVAGTGAGANNAASTPGLAITGRNTLQLNSINNWDMTLAKHLKFGERYQVDFMAQMLNAFNHPQFVPGSPNQANDISILGRDFLIPSSTTFMQWKSVFPSNVRTMQLGLKFIF
jgi:hypothetical protein